MTRSKFPSDTARDDIVFVESIFRPADVPAPRLSLKSDVLATFDEEWRRTPQRKYGISKILDLVERLRLVPAGAFMSVAVLGLVVGAMTPGMSMRLAPEDEIYFYSEDAANLAFLESEELEQWLVN